MQLFVASRFPLPAIEPSCNHLLQWGGLHAPYENVSHKDRAGQQCSPSELEDVQQDPFVDARPLFEVWVPEGVIDDHIIRGWRCYVSFPRCRHSLPLLLLLVSLYASDVTTAIDLTIALVVACAFCVVVVSLVQANLLLPW